MSFGALDQQPPSFHPALSGDNSTLAATTAAADDHYFFAWLFMRSPSHRTDFKVDAIAGAPRRGQSRLLIRNR